MSQSSTAPLPAGGSVVIISPNGVSDAGGLERVMLYAARVLSGSGMRVELLDNAAVQASASGWLWRLFRGGIPALVLRSIAFSVEANRRRRLGAFVVANGYSACLARADILFCHGSMRGNRFAKAGYPTASGRREARSRERDSAKDFPAGSGSTPGWRSQDSVAWRNRRGTISLQRLFQRCKLAIMAPDEAMEAMAGRRARLLVAVSPRAKEEWAELYHLDSSRIRVLPNPVDTGHFSPSVPECCSHADSDRSSQAHEAAEACRVAGFDNRKMAGTGKTILFVGRLELRKGIDRLKNLVLFCSDHETSSRFRIATPDQDNAGYFDDFPSVQVSTGVSLADLPALYRSCDVMYFPSFYEGFEMVTLESLACGTPVVGGPVGAIGYLASIGFPGVYTVDTGNPSAALDGIREASAQWMGDESRRRLHAAVEERFSLTSWARDFLRIVGDVDV